MVRRLWPGLLGVLVVALAGCTVTLPQGESGSIATLPFFDQGMGIQGVVPAGCRQSNPGTFECANLYPGNQFAMLVQQAMPGSLDELTKAVVAQTALEQLPEPTGSYRGAAFTWDLYALETQVLDVPGQTFRIDLALTEDGTSAYLVALVTLPEEYETHAKVFDTIFCHAVYALVPMD